MSYREPDHDSVWEARLAHKERELEELRAAHWAATLQIDELRSLRASAMLMCMTAVAAAVALVIAGYSVASMLIEGPSWSATGWLALSVVVGWRAASASYLAAHGPIGEIQHRDG